MNTAWTWVGISLFLIVILGIIIWFAIVGREKKVPQASQALKRHQALITSPNSANTFMNL